MIWNATAKAKAEQQFLFLCKGNKIRGIKIQAPPRTFRDLKLINKLLSGMLHKKIFQKAQTRRQVRLSGGPAKTVFHLSILVRFVVSYMWVKKAVAGQPVKSKKGKAQLMLFTPL